VEAANQEAGRHRAKLKRKFIRQMIADKRGTVLREGWEAFLENNKLKRGVEWHRKRFIRLVWGRLRTEIAASRSIGPDQEDGS